MRVQWTHDRARCDRCRATLVECHVLALSTHTDTVREPGKLRRRLRQRDNWLDACARARCYEVANYVVLIECVMFE